MREELNVDVGERQAGSQGAGTPSLLPKGAEDGSQTPEGGAEFGKEMRRTETTHKHEEMKVNRHSVGKEGRAAPAGCRAGRRSCWPWRVRVKSDLQIPLG